MRRKLFKLLVAMMISATALFALGMTAAAENVGAFEVTGGTKDTDYTYEEGVLTIKTATPITIANTDPNTPTTDRILVADGVNANVTLAGVNIKLSGWGNCALKIADNSTGDVTVTLADGTTNTLASSNNAAGLQKNGSGDDVGTLTINGTGTLNASTESVSSYSAGIGGSVNNSTKNIIITSGIINATGSPGAAGIGSGGRYDYNGVLVADNIQIKGGTITATGVSNGAGIGGGFKCAGSNITISGGTVIAIGGTSAAGIGGGRDGAGSNITINGGTVTATGGIYAAGIGGGDGGAGSDITISGGTVTATGGKSSAAIGGGYYNEGSNITIKNSIVYVTAVQITDPIGDGAYSSNSLTDTPTIIDAIIVDDTAKIITVYGNATLTEDFEVPADYTMTIPEGATLTVGTDVTFTNNGAVTNNGTIENEGTITGNAVDGTVIALDFVITGGTEGTDYTYTGGVLTVIKNGANLTVANKTPSTPTTNKIKVADGVSANITLAGVNIDGSLSKDDEITAFKIADNSTGNVTITLADGTTNTLKSGYLGAGLNKSGDGDNIGRLTIQGGPLGTGSLFATGGDEAPGIGSVFERACSNITISGGNVTATGGDEAAGIGGGFKCAVSKITISGGTVTAIGGTNGAGIGGGAYRDGSDIIISGGSVKAVAGTDANAIGGGADKDAVTPTDGNGNNVYLLEIENADNADIVINGKDYPDKHFDEAKIYAYLPAKTALTPNEVAVGEETTKYCYDTANSKWLEVVEAPAEDETEFIYDGEEKTYSLAEGEHYTISDNTTQTDAGTYTVTAALNDKENTIWNSGTTDDEEYEFTIGKATPTADMFTYTAPSSLDYDGQQKTATVTIDKVGMGEITVKYSDTPINAGTYTVSIDVAEGDNYNAVSDLEVGTFTINGIAPTYTAPTPIESLTYTGQAQALITAGETADGEIQYSLDGITYTSTVPTGTAVGDYTVYCKIIGDSNHNDKTFDPITVSIGKGVAPEIFEPTAAVITYGQALSASALSDSAWSWVNGTEIPTVMNSGYNASMIVTDDNNYDYSAVMGYDALTHTVTRTIPVAVVPAIPTVVVNATPAADIAGKPISAAVTVTNPNNASLFDTPTAELTYTIDGFTVPFTGSFVIPEDTAEGTIITITATTMAYGNYDYAIGTTTVTVTSCTHENTTLMSDTDSHWYECLYCEADIDKTTHSGGMATCNTKASCGLCYTTYGEFDSTNHANNVSTVWTTENSYHWHECNGCGTDIDKGACTGGTATCMTAAICETCGAAHGTVDPNNHTGNVSTVWTSDSEYHWYGCACGAEIDKAGHTSSGAATEDTAESCTICGYVIAPATGHIKHTADTSKWLSDSTGHWHKCVGCEEKMDKTTHISGGAATATTPETCTVCGYVISPALGIKPTPDSNPTPNPSPKPIPIPSPTITVNNEPQIKDENGKMGWDAIKDEIEDADEGDVIVVDMNGTTKLPKDITSEIKGRDITLVLEMNGGITWTINGLDVTNPKNVDMRVSKGAKRIPVEVINNVTGESYTVQLSLAHNGDFGFTAVLTIDLGKKNNGLVANLLWYNEKTDELEHVDFDEIQNGKAELMFTHASEWAVVIDEKVLGEYDDVSSAAGITDNGEILPDSNAPIAVAAISFAGLVLAAVIAKKKKA